MKISDRISLLKAGYSKAEIDAMIQEEKASESVPDVETTETEDKYAAALTALAGEVKKLKEGMQTRNIEETEIQAPASSVDDALEILGSIINPDFNKKEEH